MSGEERTERTDREAVFTDLDRVDVRRWRVGSKYRIHVYCGDVPVATFRTAIDAADAVGAHNDALDVGVRSDDPARSTRLYLDPMDDGPSRPPSSDPRGQRWFDLIRGWEEEPSGNDDNTIDLVERCMLLADQEMTLWTKRALKAEDEVDMLVNTDEDEMHLAVVEKQLARAGVKIEHVKALIPKWRADRATYPPGDIRAPMASLAVKGCEEELAAALRGEPCPTCSGPTRETVGMVCQTCGTDYGHE